LTSRNDTITLVSSVQVEGVIHETISLRLGGSGRVHGHGGIVTEVLGINNAGQMVGRYVDSGRSGHGFLFSGGQYTMLDVPGGSSTGASGINNAAQIVGSYPVGGPSRGFLLSSGSYTVLDAPQAAYTFANGINDSGQIVGSYHLPGNTQGYGFLLSGGNYTMLDVPGSRPGSTSANGINNLGQIVGSSTTGGFLLSQGTYTALKVPGTPDGINDLGQIVGTYRIPGGLDEFVYEGFLLSGGNYTRLNVPDAISTYSFGINNAGQIVGWYTDFHGVHGFLATPAAAPVPEPSTLLLLTIGTLGVIGWARRTGLPSARGPGLAATRPCSSAMS
jgi:uncharacterized membrane protein